MSFSDPSGGQGHPNTKPQVDSLQAQVAPRPNLLINGDGLITQNGVTAIRGDAQWSVFDCWVQLTSASFANATGYNDDNHQSAMLITTAGSGGGVALAQILELAHSLPLVRRWITLSGKVLCTAQGTVYYAILEWNGTSDTITSKDFVNNWNSTDYDTPGQFFVSGVNILGVGTAVVEDINVWTPITPLTLFYDPFGDANNIIVIFWSPSFNEGHGFSFNAKLEVGESPTPNYPSNFSTELLKCQRYYWQTHPYGTTPAQNDGVQQGAISFIMPTGASGQWVCDVRHPTIMRKIPTVTTYNPFAPNVHWRDLSNNANRTVGIGAVQSGASNTAIQASGCVQGARHIIHASFDARL